MARYEVARTEQSGEGHVLVYGGEEYNLPAAMPVLALEAMASENVIGFLHALMGDQWEAFAKRFNTEDMAALAEVIGEMYGGGTPGESVASGGSSKTDTNT